jgi:hypothetical protein
MHLGECKARHKCGLVENRCRVRNQVKVTHRIKSNKTRGGRQYEIKVTKFYPSTICRVRNQVKGTHRIKSKLGVVDSMKLKSPSSTPAP